MPIEGSSARSPTPSHRHVIGPASLFVGLDRRLSGSVPGCGADSQPLPTESPFARSRCCRPRPTLQAQVGGSYPAFVALTGSCARPLSSRRLWSSLFLRVFAGCIESLLPSGPSRRYLCDPCLGAWVPYPATLRRCLCPFLPACPRPHPRVKGFGSWDDPATQFYAGGLFRGCNHSLMFRLRCSLGPQTVPTFRFSFLPPLGRIHRAVFAPLPVTNSGIATCPNRTTDTIELAVALAPAHLLDRSLVGCS